MKFASNSITITSGDFLPSVSGTQDLGSSSLPFGNIYCDDLYSKGSSIHIGNSEISAEGTGGTIHFKNGNVGIGTDPSYKLEVSGNAKVTGLHINTSTKTADYTLTDTDDVVIGDTGRAR